MELQQLLIVGYLGRKHSALRSDWTSFKKYTVAGSIVYNSNYVNYKNSQIVSADIVSIMYKTISVGYYIIINEWL